MWVPLDLWKLPALALSLVNDADMYLDAGASGLIRSDAN